ncbi:uncharacterized protein LOC144212236 [Stigmatopora nigra]
MVMTSHHTPHPPARLVLLVLLAVTLTPAADAAPAPAQSETGDSGATEDLALVSPPLGAGQDAWSDEPAAEESSPEPARVLALLLRALDGPAEWDADRETEAELNETGELLRDFEEDLGGEPTAGEGSLAAVPGEEDEALRRKVRGYFQNIDLGLQDNEILPPLKGYKAYNTQLARAGKKLRWRGDSDAPVKGDNFMDDFEDEGEELEEVEEEDQRLTHVEEEARARAEKQEVLRQQEEAERAREEEQRLADVASDMLLRYMGRKQQALVKARQKSGNAAEDKRSEELLLLPERTQADLDQQMIDRLIEISSKLHLPADDVVEIISDVEEKKKKRKEVKQQQQQQVPMPRFRPLVPPPLARQPLYHYTASTNPKKALYKSMKKWQKDKGRSRKQDFWYHQAKTPLDYWYKPQKQFLAFPSYPYYQKPYRAYYPVYFPYPKQRYYGKRPPVPEQPFAPPQDLEPQPPWRGHRGQGKNRGQGQGWKQRPAARLQETPYISNYILPHPRTYQLPPPPKPLAPPRRGRRPPFYYPPAAPRTEDYEEDGLVPQVDSEEELENFIERIYMKRRMY